MLYSSKKKINWIILSIQIKKINHHIQLNMNGYILSTLLASSFPVVWSVSPGTTAPGVGSTHVARTKVPRPLHHCRCLLHQPSIREIHCRWDTHRLDSIGIGIRCYDNIHNLTSNKQRGKNYTGTIDNGWFIKGGSGPTTAWPMSGGGMAQRKGIGPDSMAVWHGWSRREGVAACPRLNSTHLVLLGLRCWFLFWAIGFGYLGLIFLWVFMFFFGGLFSGLKSE